MTTLALVLLPLAYFFAAWQLYNFALCIAYAGRGHDVKVGLLPGIIAVALFVLSRVIA